MEERGVEELDAQFGIENERLKRDATGERHADRRAFDKRVLKREALIVIEGHLDTKWQVAGKERRRDLRRQNRLGCIKARDAHGLDSQSAIGGQLNITLYTH